MDKILPQYHPLDPTTWTYLSSLLTIAIYFKFSRFWSLRNLDLVWLIALAPGLLLAQSEASERHGYFWLFAVGGLFLVRLLIDPMMVRRPLLEPNLSTGGMTFIGASLLVFLTVNVLTKSVDPSDLDGLKMLQSMLERKDIPATQTTLAMHGPGYPLLHLLPNISMRPLVGPGDAATEEVARRTVQAMAILGHLAVVLGMILIGLRHFDNIRTGIAAATLYLLVPYTATMTGRVYHVLPAALLVWMVLTYRRPLVSGLFLGLASGAFYYPMFLLPLWIAFYWQRGLLRYLLGFCCTLALVVASLAFISSDAASFVAHVKQMFGWSSLTLEGAKGFWGTSVTPSPYRITVLVAFVTMCMGFALWPAQKNLGTLLGCSAAVMLGTQFWQAQEGGLHVAWYLPLLLMTVFRPNLEDRVALSTLGEGWFARRKSQFRIRAA